MKGFFNSWLMVLLILLVTVANSCKKDENNNNDNNNTQTQQWEIEIAVNITDPEPSPFTISGDVDITIDGDQVTFTGDYTIGNLSFENVIFEGMLTGTQVSMTTSEYQVTFESNGTTYTEDISWSLAPFNVLGNTATGAGTITATKNPGNTTESGTYTFTTTRVD